MRNIVSILRRDLGAYFTSPIGYIFIMVFVTMSVLEPGKFLRYCGLTGAHKPCNVDVHMKGSPCHLSPRHQFGLFSRISYHVSPFHCKKG